MKNIKVLLILPYVLIILVLVILGLSYIIDINEYIIYGSFFAAGFAFLGIVTYYRNKKLHKQINWLEERVKLGNSISYRVKVAGEKSFNEIPIGIIVYSNDYHIEWANNYARSIFLSTLIDRKIANISKELDIKVKSMTDFDIELYGKEYNVIVLKEDNILFLRDKTEFKKLEKKYNDRTTAMGIINLDNFDEAVASIDPQVKALLISDLVGILSTWAEKYDVYIRGYSEKQYLIFMDRSQLEKIIVDEFDVIDEVNEYCNKESLKMTASIGIACADIPVTELMDKANELLELALNRGGNQTVCEVDGNIKYYGGKVRGADTRVPVYVRVKTEELCDVISKSQQVIIMTHTVTDADAFGSSIAALKIAKAMKKEAYIVFDYDVADITVREVYNDLASEHVGMTNYFISPTDAISRIDDQTLLLIVDVQYARMLIDERIYKKARKVAIVDHHRSNDSAISNYNYLYNKTSSSSSVELLVEMFDYLDEDVVVTPMEATLMLLGVITDTSNLMYRTSYQTFSVLSKLQLFGAEMTKVQRYLREDFDMYVKRMNILNNVEMVENKYGIAMCDDHEIFARQFLAKVSDSLILVETIKAGFCIGKISENQVGISARSLDEVNVQLIMEALEGGGHFNNAATQITGITINEAKERLINVLKKQETTGEETMKVILVKDVKGKGKANDVIEIPSGHANYLIRSKLAILATPDNLNELKRQNELEKKEAQDHLEAMRELKEFIEKNPINVAARVGKEGKLFGTVSTKQIVDEMKNKYDITLDKRKIMYDKEIDSLGTYEIPIQLHKEVVAKITLHVIEKA